MYLYVLFHYNSGLEEYVLRKVVYQWHIVYDLEECRSYAIYADSKSSKNKIQAKELTLLFRKIWGCGNQTPSVKTNDSITRQWFSSNRPICVAGLG